MATMANDAPLPRLRDIVPATERDKSSPELLTALFCRRTIAAEHRKKAPLLRAGPLTLLATGNRPLAAAFSTCLPCRRRRFHPASGIPCLAKKPSPEHRSGLVDTKHRSPNTYY